MKMKRNLTEVIPPTRTDPAMMRNLRRDVRKKQVPLSQVVRSIIREHYQREAAK